MLGNITGHIKLFLLILQCWHIRVNHIEDVCHCVFDIKALGCGT